MAQALALIKERPATRAAEADLTDEAIAQYIMARLQAIATARGHTLDPDTPVWAHTPMFDIVNNARTHYIWYQYT